ncbi:MAG: PorT family protein [Lentimicrobiaceae bacterium]|jgi:hypothetical protein|nr:PorT family protein [Lentimicrobiaceae bacterium]MCP4909775.1 PorT family protein [Bacteroidota bacterium]MBT3453713.1 PorT family protein [Lentimicrobiaceae bacterium]MBT3819563.1 PorT family protein [Lentimicrobiaceae bacterium]MBT4061357.1 PorT family protein [Lentimicrobiaceae bacterium]
MRRFIIVIILVMAGFVSQSQVLITILLGDKLNSDGLEFGLEGGLNWSNISGLETNSFARKWNLGFYFDIRIKNQWFLYTGVLVKSNSGVDKLKDGDLDMLNATKYLELNGESINGDYNQVMNYFLVPVLIKYKTKKYFYGEIGPQFGLMHKSYIEFTSDIDGKDATIREYNKDNINKIDVGIMVGIGYQLLKGNGWTIGAKYYYGFIDVYREIENTKNSSIFLKMNIPIGAGKKDAKNNTN